MNWGPGDFLAVGGLVAGAGLAYVLATRNLRKHRVVIGILIVALAVWLWIELAVGLFTEWGD